MKFHFSIVRSTVSISLGLLVAACGGGGGGGDAAPATSTASASVSTSKTYSQTEANSVAALGLLTGELLPLNLALEHGFFANFLQGLSTGIPAGSSPPVVVPCSSTAGGNGSLTVSVAKNGIYAGLKPTDSIDMTFNSCTFAGTSLMLNGRAVLTPTADYVNLTANFVVQYNLTTTNFNITNFAAGGLQIRSHGSQLVNYDATAAGPGFPEISSVATTPYSLRYFSSSTSAEPFLTYTVSPLASMFNATTSSNTFTSRLDGNFAARSSTEEVFLALFTLSPLKGNLTTGRPLPTSGVLRAKDTGLNLQTETTIQGLSALVKADSDGNATLDLSFNTTYLALTN